MSDTINAENETLHNPSCNAAAKKSNDLLYIACLIETIARTTTNHRLHVLQQIGKGKLLHVYEFADVFHCLSLAQGAAEIIEECDIKNGTFDNVATAHYSVPHVIGIARDYVRLVEDTIDTKTGNVYDCDMLPI